MNRSFGHEDAGSASAESLDSIVKNFSISSFLDSNEKRYIVGPKGTGKTLLLLRRAIDQRKRGDGLCIPSQPDLPVDRLLAAQHVGEKFNHKVSDDKESNLAWAAVWKHSIYLSTLHHIRQQLIADGERAEWEEIAGITNAVRIDDMLAGSGKYPPGPFYYFTRLGAELDSSPHKRLQEAREENLAFDLLLRDHRRPIYVFLDNLDDYYEKEPELWFNSLYGQFRAVREISLAHRQLHVFTSIRQDVYEQFADEMRLQYYDYVAHLEYKRDELLNIFASRVRQLDTDLLCLPDERSKDPWHAFFGECRTITNEFVDFEEDIQDYILRHTLRRPRDMVHMGTVLLEKRPTNGFDPDSVRDAVATAEKHIAEQYLAEVTPLLDDRFNLRDLLKSYVTSAVIQRDEIAAITDAFVKDRNDLFDYESPSDLTRPFVTLYELGLLGCVQEKSHSRHRVQRFRRPGLGLPDWDERSLPESDLYFVHPVLHSYVSPAKRDHGIIVGHGLPVDLKDGENN